MLASRKIEVLMGLMSRPAGRPLGRAKLPPLPSPMSSSIMVWHYSNLLVLGIVQRGSRSKF